MHVERRVFIWTGLQSLSLLLVTRIVPGRGSWGSPFACLEEKEGSELQKGLDFKKSVFVPLPIKLENVRFS